MLTWPTASFQLYCKEVFNKSFIKNLCTTSKATSPVSSKKHTTVGKHEVLGDTIICIIMFKRYWKLKICVHNILDLLLRVIVTKLFYNDVLQGVLLTSNPILLTKHLLS